MILKTLLGLSLVMPVALDTQAPPAVPAAWTQIMSVREKDAALLPLVQRATQCIIRRVSTDPRYKAVLRPSEINDLIVDSITACKRPVRAMIDAHDLMYSYGSGEAFLLGPYLDGCRRR